MNEREQKIEKLKTYFQKRDDVVMAFLLGILLASGLSVLAFTPTPNLL